MNFQSLNDHTNYQPLVSFTPYLLSLVRDELARLIKDTTIGKNDINAIGSNAMKRERPKQTSDSVVKN